ncbi:MAG: FtsH protease activity modulator HflK [Anderseniella sp.]|jgi:membrane protease subunit HflK|nr:FtsH protease activity modulator HflK [Anderseniella sp.]
MPWNTQGGGNGPWGQGPSGGGGGGGRSGGPGTPPDLEDLIRKGQDRLKTVLPQGGGGKSPWIIGLIALGALWAFNSFHTIEADEQGVVLRLGEFNRTVAPGLQFAAWPVETIEVLPVEAVNQINLGSETREQGLMLAGDQNLVNVDYTVQWKIAEPQKFLFNIREQEKLVQTVTESAMREIVGRTPAEEIRTRGRSIAQQQVRDLVQQALDSYDAGISILGIQLNNAQPPQEVSDAFEEVQRAEQNQNQFIREAEQYRNRVLGSARGEASKIVEDAKGYSARIVNEAEGEAERFKSIYAEYAKAKDVTRKRLFLEMMEDVMSKSNKVIVEGNAGGQGGSGVVPYLPLPEIQKRQQQQSSGGNQ